MLGEPILAVAAGQVVHVGPMWLDAPGTGRGPYAVIIQHSPGYFSTYGHQQQTLVKEGDCVVKGQLIAEMGSLGYSGGPHLHYEVLDNATWTGNWQLPFNNACSKYIDPLQLKYYLYPAP